MPAKEKIVALGEIGLDYHYEDNPARKLQKKHFEGQLELAERLKMPFLFPLFGSGVIYGQSVSMTSLSNGAYFTTSFSFFAFLKVNTPPIPI